MKDNHELFKLNTRRYLFWGVAGMATISLSFLTITGAYFGIMEYVALGGGGLLTELGAIIGFYTAKKTGEE